MTDAVHLSLFLGQCSQLSLQRLQLLLQLCSPGCCLVDFGCHLGYIILKLSLFGFSFRKLLIAISFFGSLVTSLLLKFGNHILDEPFDLGKRITSRGTEPETVVMREASCPREVEWYFLANCLTATTTSEPTRSLWVRSCERASELTCSKE